MAGLQQGMPGPFAGMDLPWLLAAKARLEADGIEVVGPTDHALFQSIYFFDPNGHRVELAADIGTPEQYAELEMVARPMLEEWRHRQISLPRRSLSQSRQANARAG